MNLYSLNLTKNAIADVDTKHPIVTSHLSRITRDLAALAIKTSRKHYPEFSSTHYFCIVGFLKGFVSYWVFTCEKTLRRAVPVLLNAGWSSDKVSSSLKCNLEELETPLTQLTHTLECDYAEGFGFGYSKRGTETNAKLAIAGRLLMDTSDLKLVAKAIGIKDRHLALHLCINLTGKRIIY